MGLQTHGVRKYPPTSALLASSAGLGWSTIAGYSPFHFARKFTLAMGISPYRYISRIRLENAMAEWLRASCRSRR